MLLSTRAAAVLLPLAILALAGVAPAQGSLSVVSVTPANNERSARPASPVTLVFDRALDATTVNGQTIRIWGRWSGAVPGALAIDGAGTTVTFSPSRPYFPAENVTVMASGDVASATGAPLAGGFTSSFWVRSAPGSGSFALHQVVDIRFPGEGLIRSYGVYAGDIDRDGSPDMSVPDEVANDVRLLRNDGCANFGPIAVHPLPAASVPSPNEGADFNGDGWTDLVVGLQSGDRIAVFLGNGAGGYLPAVLYNSGDNTRGVAVLDADADGDADVVTANRNSNNLALHRNNGGGTFAPATFFDGGGSGETTVATADANGDGKPDLFVGNYNSSTVTLLLGNGAGGFALSATQAAGSNPWMIAVGDVDGDGHADAVTANSGQNRFGVVRGNGAGGLLPVVTYPVGNFPLAIDLGDLEGDGDLDVVVSNYGGASFTIYRNDGTGVFVSPTTFPAGQAGSCAVVVDYDRDGDADIVGIDELVDKAYFFRQAGPSPAGVQAPACEATLRANNWANRAGYGGAAEQPVAVGSTLFLGITGAPSVPFALAFGVAFEPGIPLPFGLLNLGVAPPPFVFFSGFGGGPGGTTNAAGEGQHALAIPASLPPWTAVAFQGILLDGANPAGLTLTNPETVLFVP